MAKFGKILFEDASEEAHHLGLSYGGWGKWKDKEGRTVAKTIQGKLVKVDPEKEPTGQDVPELLPGMEKGGHQDIPEVPPDMKSGNWDIPEVEPSMKLRDLMPKPVGAPEEPLDDFSPPEEPEPQEPDPEDLKKLEPDFETEFEPSASPEHSGDFLASRSPTDDDADEYVPPPGEYQSTEGGLAPLLGTYGNDYDRARAGLAKASVAAKGDKEKLAKIQAMANALKAQEEEETSKMREKLAALDAKKKAEIEKRRQKYPMARDNPNKHL